MSLNNAIFKNDNIKNKRSIYNIYAPFIRYINLT